MYQVEIVWNREFDFRQYGKPHSVLDDAIKFAREMENSGDGARVKKTQVVDIDGNVVYAHGKKTRRNCSKL